MCMPALGGRIKSGLYEIDKTLRVYIIFQQHPRNPRNSYTLETKTKSKISYNQLIRLNLIRSNIKRIQFNTF